VVARNANLLLNDVDFGNALRDGLADGKQVLQQLKEHFQEYKAVDPRYRPAIDKWISGISRNAAKAVLFKPKIWFYQPVSLENACQEMPRKYAYGAFTGVYSNLTNEQLKQMMPKHYQRFKGSAYMLMSPALQQSGRDAWRAFYGMKPKTLDRIMMGGVKAADTKTIRAICTGCYHWAKDDGFTGKELYLEAERRASRVIRRSQPTMDATNISNLQLQGRKKPWFKPLVMFSTQANQGLNQAVRAGYEWEHSEKKAGDFAKMVRNTLRPTLLTGFAVHVIGSGVDFLQGLATGDKREREWWEHAGRVLDRSYGGWLLGRDLMYMARSSIEQVIKNKGKVWWKQPRDNLVAEVMNEAYRVITKLAESGYAAAVKQKDFKKKAAELLAHLNRLLSYMLGLPGVTIEGFVPAMRKAARR
jgi:hypothetical protein